MLSNGKLSKSLLHGIGGGDYGGNHGSVTFGAGVAFTVNAGTDKDTVEE